MIMLIFFFMCIMFLKKSKLLILQKQEIWDIITSHIPKDQLQDRKSNSFKSPPPTPTKSEQYLNLFIISWFPFWGERGSFCANRCIKLLGNHIFHIGIP